VFPLFTFLIPLFSFDNGSSTGVYTYREFSIKHKKIKKKLFSSSSLLGERQGPSLDVFPPVLFSSKNDDDDVGRLEYIA
jgi:hypothetical protein